MAKVLLADDEEDLRSALAEAMEGGGHSVAQAATAEDGIQRLQKEIFDVVIADLRMPGKGGLDLLREASARMPDGVFLVMTAHGTMEDAIEALRIGAHDFILKPINLAAFLEKLGSLVRFQSAAKENRILRRALEIQSPSTGLIGKSDSIRSVHRLISKVAPTDSTVLIVGETGTGKELVARAIHEQGPKNTAPFVAVNCGSITETLLESELFGHLKGAFTGADRNKRGYLEAAGDGTVVLDEIGELPLTLQPKLLRALESREVYAVGSTSPIRISARIIAATHRDLPEMMADGRFRSDLYYRLNVFEIRLPPLRERRADIADIARHLLKRICGRMNRPSPELEPDALLALEQYDWPGNVRELSNLLERAVILADADRITVGELPGLISAAPPRTGVTLKQARRDFERAHILRVVEEHKGDKKAAAEALDVDLSSLYRKLQGEDS